MGGDRGKRKSPSAVDKLFDLLFVSIVFAQIERKRKKSEHIISMYSHNGIIIHSFLSIF